ncbi:glycosyltransferase family 2 protein [bacterium]|nr:MAG: glycosyltransferase family 2 protein [bacterium]
MSGLPKISICIPTFNRSDLLRKTLISVSKQTAIPYEVIIVDNCSDDNTEDVAKDFPAFKYYKNNTNLGMIGNWNRCIDLASGHFLSILHSDDLISPHWYEDWQFLIDKYNRDTIGAYFSAVFIIDTEENTRVIYKVFSKDTLLKSAQSFKALWLRNMCALPASAALIYRKTIFDMLGKFDSSWSTEADIAFALKIINRFDLFYTPKLLFAYRIHPFQAFDLQKQTKSLEKRRNVLLSHLKVIKDFYNGELKPEYRSPYFYKRIIYMYMTVAIFHFLTFKSKAGEKYFEFIRQVYPDLHFSFWDYFLLLTVIFHYIYKLLWGKVISLPIKRITKDWIKS